jgi:hypothetical protein
MGNESGFRQAAARFSAEVERALTRARRAVRDARAESGEFRQRTEEIVAQAKAGKAKRPRRAETEPTDPSARAEATEFRKAHGLPVPDLPADEQAARPRRARAEDEFADVTVLFDVDNEPLEADRTTGDAVGAADGIDSPEPEVSRSSEQPDDFSQQRILMDATAETYRPDEVQSSVVDDDEPRNRR